MRDAGDDIEPPPPRRWLLGNQFCRRFLSGLVAPGSTGKTALRMLQCLSLAIGRSLSGVAVCVAVAALRLALFHAVDRHDYRPRQCGPNDQRW